MLVPRERGWIDLLQKNSPSSNFNLTETYIVCSSILKAKTVPEIHAESDWLLHSLLHKKCSEAKLNQICLHKSLICTLYSGCPKKVASRL